MKKTVIDVSNIKSFKIRLYPTEIYLRVFIHNDLDKLKSTIIKRCKNKNILIDSITETCVFHHEDLYFHEDNYTPIFMAIHKQDLELGIIIHESYHVISELFKSMNYKEDYDNDEFGAYMIEYVALEIIKKTKYK